MVVFGLSSSLPLVGRSGGLECESVGKADVVIVDLQLTCHAPPRLITFTFRSSDVMRLLLDLDHYGGTPIEYDS